MDNNKILAILPNFTIFAYTGRPLYILNLERMLNRYCVKVMFQDRVQAFQITAQSYWAGLNSNSDPSNEQTTFEDFLRTYGKNEIPENVLVELTNFKSKYGKIELLGDSCLKFNDAGLLEQMKNLEVLKEKIVKIEGNLVFVDNISLRDLSETIEAELSHPVSHMIPKLHTYIVTIKDPDSKEKAYAVNAPGFLQALRDMYAKHEIFSEKLLLEQTKEITPEKINNFVLAQWRKNRGNRVEIFLVTPGSGVQLDRV